MLDPYRLEIKWDPWRESELKETTIGLWSEEIRGRVKQFVEAQKIIHSALQ